MTRKDLEAIAAVLRKAKPDTDGLSGDFETWRGIVESFATAGYTWNARFNAARFIAACGLES